jgi:hypothetical protein
MTVPRIRRETTLFPDLPGRPNATIRSPLTPCLDPQIGLGLAPSGAKVLNYRTICCDRRNGHEATKPVVAGHQFRSLRLSVRTPPFHGGESGSIPLGSASVCPKHLSPRGQWHSVHLAGLGDGEKRMTSIECGDRPFKLAICCAEARQSNVAAFSMSREAHASRRRTVRVAGEMRRARGAGLCATPLEAPTVLVTRIPNR